MVSRKFKPIDTDPNDLHYGEFRRLRELVYCVMTAEFVSYRVSGFEVYLQLTAPTLSALTDLCLR